jgi:hypothetical protein
MIMTRRSIIVQAVMVAITVGYRWATSCVLFSAIEDVTAVDETIPPIAHEKIIPLWDP